MIQPYLNLERVRKDMISSKLAPVLAAVDVVLLAVILVFPVSGSGSQKETVIEAAETTSSRESEGQSSSSSAVPEKILWETETQALAIPETWKTSDIEKTTKAPESLYKETQTDLVFDIAPFDTREKARLEDFNWVTPEIVSGICPQESEEMVFAEALGGWKCYIWDDTGMERLANMDFAGTEENLVLTFDWDYVHNGVQDRGYNDNTPDSVFRGSLAGNVEAEGPGKVTLTDFYRIDDHQYAFGTIKWPDGVSGHMMLVRP